MGSTWVTFYISSHNKEKTMIKVEDKNLWKDFDALFDNVDKFFTTLPFETTQKIEVPFPVTLGNDMKLLLDKYNILKEYVTKIEGENRQSKSTIKDLIESAEVLRSVIRQLKEGYRPEVPKSTVNIKPSLHRIIELLTILESKI